MSVRRQNRRRGLTGYPTEGLGLGLSRNGNRPLGLTVR